MFSASLHKTAAQARWCRLTCLGTRVPRSRASSSATPAHHARLSSRLEMQQSRGWYCRTCTMSPSLWLAAALQLESYILCTKIYLHVLLSGRRRQRGVAELRGRPGAVRPPQCTQVVLRVQRVLHLSGVQQKHSRPQIFESLQCLTDSAAVRPGCGPGPA